MTDGPTQQQIHDLTQELIALQTLVADKAADEAKEQAKRAFAISPPHALIAMAAVTAMRFERVRQLTIPADATQIEFPREVLRQVPNRGLTGLLERCIDLAENVWREEPYDEVLDSLLAEPDGGEVAFMFLLGMAREMARGVVRFDNSVGTVQDLIAQEGVESEAEWLRRGESYDEPS